MIERSEYMKSLLDFAEKEEVVDPFQQNEMKEHKTDQIKTTLKEEA